ncbi:hypothetical protein CBR_g3320 [Chara braunii]|uniref:Uncharacterized protein n=1 Tax=Chara braunii TaxID=69332 RepID=A0A388KFF2_CHABU|nr:hypothetical protein CBR_g3320 [Chara braunii]|eukprot:GBG68780.1 hypothetical protein CBR_g3320 [Chara braunii]
MDLRLTPESSIVQRWVAPLIGGDKGLHHDSPFLAVDPRGDLPVFEVRVEGEERIEQFKQHIQMELEFRWKSVKLTLDTLHRAKDIEERIRQFSREWLGGDREGWVAEVSWSGDGNGGEDREGGQEGRSVPRDYRLKFKDWLTIDCTAAFL